MQKMLKQKLRKVASQDQRQDAVHRTLKRRMQKIFKIATTSSRTSKRNLFRRNKTHLGLLRVAELI